MAPMKKEIPKVSSGIVERVVNYVIREIVDDPEAVEVVMIEQSPNEVLAEVRTNKSDMGRVIGRRGRVAKAIRTVAQAAADEEGIEAGVEFLD
jgi:predicted RNA-binding protein YlqC (UPF0109 family)